VIVRRLCVVTLLGKGGSGKVRADLLSYVELVYGSVHIIRLIEDNKEEEELVDVDPH